MNSALTTLLQNLAFSRRWMLDAVRDLSSAELSRRPSPGFRSCARLLGMSAVADREVLRLLDVDDLPDVPPGFEARFARWSTGEDGETLRYDSALPEIFASHRNALIRATGALKATALDEPVDAPDHLDEEGLFEFGTVGEMIAATSFYTCFLVGEMSIVRVALGKAPVDDPFDAALSGAQKA